VQNFTERGGGSPSAGSRGIPPHICSTLDRACRAELARATHFTNPFVDFFADSSNFSTIAKFAVTPEDAKNVRISPSKFSRERGTLEFYRTSTESKRRGEETHRAT
jgi:hypothetical protein